MGSTEKRVIVLSDSITIPAQNALLKFLEELSDDTFVFFLVKSKDQLLETILSRSQVVNVGIGRTDSTLLKDLSTLRKDQDIVAALFIYAASISTVQEYEQFLLAVRTTILQVIIDRDVTQETAIFEVLRQLHLQYQVVKENNINPKFTVEMGYASEF
jgi:DNA polymerase III delta prime subunit